RVRGAAPRRGQGPPVRAERDAQGGCPIAELAVRAPMGWLGPGTFVDDVVVAVDRGRIEFAGGGATIADDVPVLDVDGFIIPGVVDRHVHIGLSEPGAAPPSATSDGRRRSCSRSRTPRRRQGSRVL